MCDQREGVNPNLMMNHDHIGGEGVLLKSEVNEMNHDEGAPGGNDIKPPIPNHLGITLICAYFTKFKGTLQLPHNPLWMLWMNWQEDIQPLTCTTTYLVHTWMKQHWEQQTTTKA